MGKPKGTGEWYDWQAIRTEYITSRISLKDLAEKHGIRRATVTERSRKEGWTSLRKLYVEKTIKKTIEKESTKTANKLAKELAIADGIADVLAKALKDTDQFRKHIVQDKFIDDEGGMSILTTERVFDKYDMRAIQQAMTALKMVEEMKRSIENIQKMDAINKQKNEEKRLSMEERRLQLEEEKRDMSKPDSEMTIHIKGYEEGWCD